MSRKIVIATNQSRKYIMDFCDSECNYISMIDDLTDNKVGNIYIGRVENVVKNINAAFVEISNKQKCYYSLNDNKNHIFLNAKNNSSVNIGDKILVQISKEDIKTKPATLSSKIEIAGKYAVVSVDVKGVTISSKLKNEPNITELKQRALEILKDNSYDFGIIIRTNALKTHTDAVINEIKSLCETLYKVIEHAKYGVFYEKLYNSAPSYIKYINTIPEQELEKIITDIPSIYEVLKQNSLDIPNEKLLFYKDELLSLDRLFSFEKNLERATGKKVWLKSGGYLVIEQTEAMTVVDVNSGKQTHGKNNKDRNVLMEETYYKTNIEAAQELCRQLKLRNLSGIIIVDFINMKFEDNVKNLMKFLDAKLKDDVVTATLVDITKLGLVEITRKNNGKSLIEQINGVKK